MSLRLIRRSGVDPNGASGLGEAGERAAGRYLARKGFRVVGRRVRLRAGEVDLLCLTPDRDTVVVVEVKTRRLDPGTRRAPPPESSITERKRRKLLLLARMIARQRRWKDHAVRIDVVAVDWPGRGRPTIRHYERAVTPS